MPSVASGFGLQVAGGAVTCLSPWAGDLHLLQPTVSQTLHWGRDPECLWWFSSLSCLHVFWKPLKTLLLPAQHIQSAWCSQGSEPGKWRSLWAILGQRTGELGQGCAGLLLGLPKLNRAGEHILRSASAGTTWRIWGSQVLGLCSPSISAAGLS